MAATTANASATLKNFTEILPLNMIGRVARRFRNPRRSRRFAPDWSETFRGLAGAA